MTLLLVLLGCIGLWELLSGIGLVAFGLIELVRQAFELGDDR